MLLSYFKRLFFIVIFIYLSFGNIFRFITIPGFRDNILITEAFLYLILFMYAILSGLIINANYNISPIYFIIILSALYGIVINGFEVKPILYSIRLILLLFSGVVAGYILFRHYRDRISKAINFILMIYLSTLIISLFIYIIFPNSVDLWQFLRGFGIIFNGDPHINRLISTYLDPNYYAAIACFPLLICLDLYKTTNKIRYFFLSVLFMLSILLTSSRSGIATMVGVLVIVYRSEIIMGLTKYKYKKSVMYSSVLLFFVFVVSLPAYYNNVANMLTRLFTMGEDASALTRLSSFRFGLSIFLEHPFLGIGYNYLSVYMQEYSTLSSVDSSLLSTLINFGLLFTFLIMIFFLFWFIKGSVRLKSVKSQYRQLRYLFHSFVLYIILILIFTSQFNNVLYYQFWLFPIVMFGTYLTLLTKEVKNGIHRN